MKDKLKKLIANSPSNVLSKFIKKDEVLFNELKKFWESKNSISYPSITALVHFYLTEQNPICEHGQIKRMGFLSQGFLGCGRVCKCNRDKNHDARRANTWTTEAREKRKQTNLKKYGVDNPIKNKNIKAKALATTKERYGVDNVFKSKEYQKQLRDGKNVENFNQLNWDVKTREIIQHKAKFISIASGKTVKEVKDILGCSLKTTYDYIHKYKCWDIIKKSETKSYLETEFKNFLNDINITFEANNRQILCPKELDIYIPDLRVGVELHGIYWHSENSGFKEKEYHYQKYMLAKKSNIQLFQFFEDEWLLKSNICKDKILNLTKKNKRIMARKCEVRPVNNDEAKIFLQENHMQGHVNASIKLGLFHNNELVSIMTFGKTRKPLGKSKYDWELYRMCSLLGYTVVGGASKLLKHFRKNYKGSIITYCDLRFGTGDVYKLLGFKYSHTSQPNYWYVKDGKRYYRYNFTKQKLIKEGYDKNLTEWQIMQNKGYDRIWDCGNSVWILTNDL